mmetsp:Transcript_32077/g.80688  ORF Transcript_32077/g.80688 Transcript_32077/m.80688 type:complete len:213 (+) Transcript_32077:1191-1829(+)
MVRASTRRQRGMEPLHTAACAYMFHASGECACVVATRRAASAASRRLPRAKATCARMWRSAAVCDGTSPRSLCCARHETVIAADSSSRPDTNSACATCRMSSKAPSSVRPGPAGAGVAGARARAAAVAAVAAAARDIGGSLAPETDTLPAPESRAAAAARMAAHSAARASWRCWRSDADTPAGGEGGGSCANTCREPSSRSTSKKATSRSRG